MNPTLTKRQLSVLTFIRFYCAEMGKMPSYRCVAHHFDFYPNASVNHIKALERKGYLARDTNNKLTFGRV